MSYNEEKDRQRREMEEANRGIRPRHETRDPDEVPDELRRFARFLAETEPPLEPILQSERGPERLDRVYYNLEKILDTVGVFEKRKAEVEKELEDQKAEERRKKEELERDRKVIHIERILGDNNDRPEEANPSAYETPFQRRPYLFESAQTGVYLPAEAMVQPRVRHFDDLNSINMDPKIYNELRCAPFQSNWGRAPSRDRPASPYAFRRRRRPNVSNIEAPVECPPAEQSNRGVLIGPMEYPLEEQNNPSRIVLQNLRSTSPYYHGIVQHEIRCMDYTRRRMGGSDAPPTTRLFISPRVHRRHDQIPYAYRELRAEDESGDASMIVGRRRRNIRPEATSSAIEVPPESNNRMQHLMRQLIITQRQIRKLQTQQIQDLVRQPQLEPETPPEAQPEAKPKQRHRSANKLKERVQSKDRDELQTKPTKQETNTADQKQPKTQPQVVNEAKPQPRTKAQRDTNVDEETEEEGGIDGCFLISDRESLDEEESEAVTDRSVVEVINLENSLSKDTRAAEVTKDKPDSTSKSDAKNATSLMQPSCSRQRPNENPEIPIAAEPLIDERHESRLISLQRGIEQLERQFLQITRNCTQTTALDELRQAWNRLAAHWERLEAGLRGIADMDLTGATHETYRDDRTILLLQHRALEEHCLFNDRRLTRAIREASESQRRVTALEAEIALLRDQQQLQTKTWEERMQEALKNNRVLTRALEKMKDLK